MPFQPKVSGNVKGRPKNTGHRQILFNSLVAPFKDKLIDKAINMALSGNEAMLKLFLERILPPKPNDEPININTRERDYTQVGMLLEAGSDILKAISNNEIAPEQGKTFLETISAQRKNIETTTLENRVTEIEFMLKLRKQEKNHA